MDESKNIQLKIRNKFKDLMKRTNSDPELKKEVFGTIAKIEGAASFLDLFTVKFVQTDATFINEISNPNNSLRFEPKNTNESDKENND